jgi:hypothetical protein
MDQAMLARPEDNHSDAVTRFPAMPTEAQISPRRRFAIPWWKPLLPRMVVAYPAFFVLKDDACDGETTRLLWKHKAR